MLAQPVLLTGATGFVGRYLLRQLTAEGARVVVLVRADGEATAVARVGNLLSETGRVVPRNVTVIPGDLSDLHLLPRRFAELLGACETVIHAAACVSFKARPNGDPVKTNAEGTASLFRLLNGGKLKHWVQVSTAYVAGRRAGRVYEEDRHHGPFRNPYEASKWQAEQFLRQQAVATGLKLTICRPGIVVGEFASGRTISYEGFYRPLRLLRLLAERFKEKPGSLGRDVSLRLELDPRGIRNLVPVDWVARQTVELAKAAAEGVRTFHLTPAEPTRNAEVVSAIRTAWGSRGIVFSAPMAPERRTRWERLFYANLSSLGPYWAEETEFDSTNLSRTLPDDPAPRIDSAAIVRLVRFADADDWGASSASRPARPTAVFPCRQYVERFLFDRVKQSSLPRLTQLDVTVALSLSGPGGGTWNCRFDRGELSDISPGDVSSAEVIYASDSGTFGRIVCGELPPAEAFFDRRFEIHGDVEMGLKLATIFGHFVREFPFPSPEAVGFVRMNEPQATR